MVFVPEQTRQALQPFDIKQRVACRGRWRRIVVFII
jgi:hypothetical protein